MVKNNYSSGRNDDRLNNPNGRNEPQAFAPDDEEEGEHLKDVMPCHSYSAVGNMNLNSMLIENIRSHDYFKGLADLKTFDEVVDQIYYDCTYCTPWKPGTHRAQRAAGMCSGLRGVSNAGIPSTCYMLLFKLYTLKLTTSQIKRLISHTDSPFIRVIGFLYVRHCCEPKSLWGWFEPYAKDSEEFSETGDTNMITMSRFIKRILTELDFHDTMLPRLPVPVQREIQKAFEDISDVGGESRQWESRRDDRREGEKREGEMRETRRGDDARDDRRDERGGPPRGGGVQFQAAGS